MQARTEFETAGVKGELLLRSADKQYSLFTAVLESGECFDIEKIQSSEGFIWLAVPEKYSELAVRIGRRVEAEA